MEPSGYGYRVYLQCIRAENWKHTGGEIEDYLLDLTKSYHNLLGLKRDAEEQMFFYDFGENIFYAIELGLFSFSYSCNS